MNGLLRAAKRFVNCCSGSALVEVTVVVPLAISLTVGVVDFSLALSARATMGKSVRDAARYLSRLPQAAVCSTAAQTVAKNIAVYGIKTAESGNEVLSGFATGDITVTPDTDCSTSPTTIEVTAAYTYQTIMLSAALPGAGSIPMAATHK